eukprot:6238958-Amphidinium_carterae.1
MEPLFDHCSAAGCQWPRVDCLPREQVVYADYWDFPRSLVKRPCGRAFVQTQCLHQLRHRGGVQWGGVETDGNGEVIKADIVDFGGFNVLRKLLTRKGSRSQQ